MSRSIRRSRLSAPARPCWRKREPVQGTFTYASEAEAWSKIGATPVGFTLDEFLTVLGRRKQTSRRTHGRLTYLSITNWGRWNAIHKRRRDAAAKSAARSEQGDGDPSDTSRTTSEDLSDTSRTPLGHPSDSSNQGHGDTSESSQSASSDAQKSRKRPESSADTEATEPGQASDIKAPRARGSESEYEGEHEHEGEEPLAAPPRKTRKPDPLWDTLVSEIGPVAYDAERKKYNAALKLIREANGTPDELRSRIARYQSLWPDVSLTAHGVATNWSLLGRPSPPATRNGGGRRDGGMTPLEIIEYTAQMKERAR